MPQRDRERLTSAGQATAERARMERAFMRGLLPIFEEFLAGVTEDALAALDAPMTLTAASGRPKLAEAFTLGKVSARWGTAQRAVQVWIEEFLKTPSELAADYFEGLSERLRTHSLPETTFTSVREVLQQAQEGRWSRKRVGEELAEALSLETGRSVPAQGDRVEREGASFRSIIERLARTEATAAYNVQKMERQRRAGYALKRWVAHHDNRTRASHLAVSGTTIPANQDFVVGGYAMAYPGDPRGPASQTANCRCVLVGARAPKD